MSATTTSQTVKNLYFDCYLSHLNHITWDMFCQPWAWLVSLRKRVFRIPSRTSCAFDLLQENVNTKFARYLSHLGHFYTSMYNPRWPFCSLFVGPPALFIHSFNSQMAILLAICRSPRFVHPLIHSLTYTKMALLLAICRTWATLASPRWPSRSLFVVLGI